MDLASLFCAHIDELEIYQPPDWERLAARAGLPPDQLVRLDANENAFGPSPRAIEALARFDGYQFYPNYQTLETAMARYAGVEPQNIVLGNGGDEIIDLVVRLFVEPGEGVIVCPPAFGMYSICVQAHRGQVLRAPRRDDFSLDVEAIEALVADGESGIRPKLLFVTTPGNPDGQPIPEKTIRRLLELPLVVVVDEAYIEFGGESVLPLLDAHANLIVLRTFSKWAGLAGLRLGYAIASPQVAGALNRLRAPYNINAAAVVAALATFDDMAYIQSAIDGVVSQRERLHAALDALPGVRPLPGQANFIFCRIDDHSGREFADALAEQGILVRSFSARSTGSRQGPSLADGVRITVGRPDQNDALLERLKAQGARHKAASLISRFPDPPIPVSRSAQVQRQTRETDVAVRLSLGGTGRYETDTGLGFLDHMLAQIAAHGLFDLSVRARGDLEIDEHHSVEDVAIGLGQALDQALGDRRGLVRMGQAYAPLDEALAHVVVDLSGRPYAVIEVEFDTPSIGAVGSDLLIHFLETLAVHARLSLHARVLYGRNDHHKAEALFKALGRALDTACQVDPRRQGVPSTKGVL